MSRKKSKGLLIAGLYSVSRLLRMKKSIFFLLLCLLAPLALSSSCVNYSCMCSGKLLIDTGEGKEIIGKYYVLLDLSGDDASATLSRSNNIEKLRSPIGHDFHVDITEQDGGQSGGNLILRLSLMHVGKISLDVDSGHADLDYRIKFLRLDEEGAEYWIDAKYFFKSTNCGLPKWP